MAKVELNQIREMLACLPSATTVPLAMMRGTIDRFGDKFRVPAGVRIEATEIGGVPAEWVVAHADGPTLLYLHGGGYAIGSPKAYRHLVALLAQQIQGRALIVDYRLAPEHPYPAALDDAFAAYRALLNLGQTPQRLAVAGDSAGGGLAFAMLMSARDQGLPMPACMATISPWVNLLNDGASYKTLAEKDLIVSQAAVDLYSAQYAREEQQRLPTVSPLFGDLRKLPPTLIQVGGDEVFLSDNQAMHEKLLAAGTPSQLNVWKDMFHVWHLYWPIFQAGEDAVTEAAEFMRRHLES